MFPQNTEKKSWTCMIAMNKKTPVWPHFDPVQMFRCHAMVQPPQTEPIKRVIQTPSNWLQKFRWLIDNSSWLVHTIALPWLHEFMPSWWRWRTLLAPLAFACHRAATRRQRQQRARPAEEPHHGAFHPRLEARMHNNKQCTWPVYIILS
jgi:hypothetical protein